MSSLLPKKKKSDNLRQAHCASACSALTAFERSLISYLWDDNKDLAWSRELGGSLVHLAESGAGRSRGSLSLLRHST